MNQDSFRQLLAAPRPGSSSSSIPARVSNQSEKKGILNPSQPAFQPRKLKKTKNGSGYRDRASERRAGLNDYAEVESILENFEQRTARIEDRDAVEEQRRYLGGDKEHTILVKGLDFALLEQNKARAAASQEDDDSLEAAFQEAQPGPINKRTRDDLIRQLKDNRVTGSVPSGPQQPAGNDALEEAKKIGRFKPIGVSDAKDDADKKRRSKEVEGVGEGGRKRKRRKVKQESVTPNNGHSNVETHAQAPGPSSSEYVEGSLSRLPDTSLLISSDVVDEAGARHLHSPPMDANEEVDIFADVGEYEGLVLDDDEDQGEAVNDEEVNSEVLGPTEVETLLTTKSWFNEKDDHKSISPPPVARLPTPPAAKPASPDPQQPEQVSRLVPLASSALPSIRDFLAMDAQAEALKKKQARKEKKKGGEKKGKVSTEHKVEKDYKKLNSYIAKKGDGASAI